MFRFLLKIRVNGAAIAAAALAACLAAADPAARADDEEVVERYLARLGLVDLQIVHLEQMIEKGLPADRRLGAARRLGDLYAQRLMVSSEDEAKSRDLRSRIATLVRNIPQVNTASLQVMMLQADYNRAEEKAVQWFADPDDLAARDHAGKVLDRIVPDLNKHREELNGAAEKLQEEVDKLQEGDLLTAKEKELERLQAVAGRATYFASWSNYYYGLTKLQSTTAGTEFAAARTGFRKLLGIEEDEAYKDVDRDWLGLEEEWASRAVIGLGLSEAALGNVEASRDCFAILEHPGVPPKIRDQGPYWLVQGLINIGRFEEARRSAKERIDAYSADASAGKVGLCVALVRAAAAKKKQMPPGKAKAISTLGITGLLNLREFDVVRQLITKYRIESDGQSGFFMKWLGGEAFLSNAEKSKLPKDYQAAARKLSAALATAEATSEIGCAAQCRDKLAWCHYRLKEYEKAAGQFKQAAEGLKASGNKTAVDSFWMAFVSYQRLAAESQSARASAITVLETIQRDFAEHPRAKKAAYYLTKLRRNLASPEESITALQNVKPGDPNYLSARYDLCQLYYNQWSRVRDQPAESARAAEKVRRAADVYLAAAKGDRNARQKLKCLLLAAEVTLDSTPADTKSAASYLARAGQQAASLPASDSLVADYHYRRMLLARKTGDDSGLRQHAARLVRDAAGSKYELPALLVLATAAEAAVKTAAGDQLRSHREEACKIYTRLVEVLGDSREVIASSKNARLANLRLAQYLSDLGRYAEAAARAEKILLAYPKDKKYLRLAGLARFQNGNYQQALPHWRTLLLGLTKASDAWYEAKYYQLASLARCDKEMFRKVFEQFRLLHPGLGTQAWREKFESLERYLRGSNKTPSPSGRGLG